jgi:uncharacterized ion transporter superfamily protein YfcC
VDWAAWGPTLLTLATAVFIAGSYSRTVKDHDKRLDGHDAEIKDLGTRMTASEAWREGYNAGRGK